MDSTDLRNRLAARYVLTTMVTPDIKCHIVQIQVISFLKSSFLESEFLTSKDAIEYHLFSGGPFRASKVNIREKEIR